MKYHNITHDDMLNGKGLRVVLWVSGCNHYCPGCQNPETWDKDKGLDFGIAEIKEIYDELNKDYIDGLTLSGGDPLFPLNRPDILALCKATKEYFPNKTIWCYTGYNWEDVKNLQVMSYIDVLVEGEFKKELKEESYPWAGSTNQRVINVPASLKTGKIHLV